MAEATEHIPFISFVTSSMSIFCKIDDKHVPLYRVMWVADVPHYCGEEDCDAEGRYEVRLEQNESLFANLAERDQLLQAITIWHLGGPDDQTQDDTPF